MITDNQLSAFLDHELPEQQMQQIRQQLAAQPELAERLAALAMTTRLIQEHSKVIDKMPLSPGLAEWMQAAPGNTPHTTTVHNIKMAVANMWQRLNRSLQQQLVIAAGVAALGGFMLGQWLPLSQQANPWPAVFAVLETQASGQLYSAGQQYQVLPQLTFLNTEQQYCRYFLLHETAAHSENIACRHKDGWQMQARYITTIAAEQHMTAEQYHLASHSVKLDKVLDQIQAGPALDGMAEQTLLQSHWQ